MSFSPRLLHRLLSIAFATTAVAGHGHALAASFGVNLRAGTYTTCFVNDPAAPDGCSATSEPGVSGMISFGPASDSSMATTASAISSADLHPSWAHVDGHTTASASSTADLRTAGLSVKTSGANLNNTGYGADGSDLAKFWDTLHFSVAGAAADTVTPIGVTFAVTGQMSSSGNDAHSQIYGSFTMGSAYTNGVDFQLSNSTNQTGNQTMADRLSAYGWTNAVWTSNADHTSNVFTGTYTLIGATQDVFTQAIATLISGNGSGNYGTGDYGLTVSLQLPSTVTYTSDSGAFLSAVPEPQTWALLLSGITALASVARRCKAALRH